MHEHPDFGRDILELQSWTRKTTGEVRRKQRAEIVLALASGLSAVKAAELLGVHRTVIYRWRDRFLAGGIKALKSDNPRSGRPRSIPAERVQAVVTLACKTTPEGSTHWSTRTMAEVAGVSQSTVQRVWSENGIKPHLVRSFKLSNDPHFEESARSNPTGTADEERPVRHHDPRLQATRNHHPLRRLEHGYRQSDRFL